MSNKHSSDVIVLNVGGQMYSTSRSTLARFSDSILAKMLKQEGVIIKDEQNNFFFDRDGCMFRHILNFLRTGELALPNDFKDFQQLFQEADFFVLPQLKEEVTKAQQQTQTYDYVKLVKQGLGNEYQLIGKTHVLESIFSQERHKKILKVNTIKQSCLDLDDRHLLRSISESIVERDPESEYNWPWSAWMNDLTSNGFTCKSVAHGCGGGDRCVYDSEIWLFERKNN